MHWKRTERTFILLRRAIAFLLVLSPGTVLAADDDLRPSYSKAGGPAGVGRYEPGKWGIVGVQLVNPTQSPVELLTVLSFDGDRDMQFGRKVWVPARARRLTWFPVRAPEEAPADSRVWQVQSFLFDAAEESETPIPVTFGQMQVENILPMASGRSLTGLIADPQDEYELTQLVWAVRLARKETKRFVVLGREQLPPTVESLEALDQLVIADEQILADAAACKAIREWLYRDGHLWLMLDKVNPAAMSQLIGDALQVALVDRIERVQLQFHSHDTRGKQPSGDVRQFEHPVRMVRAVFSGFEASHTVDDWPVAAWTDAGRGKLLVTTLGARAWVRPRTWRDQLPDHPDDPNDGVHFVATDALEQVAFAFVSQHQPPPVEPADFEPIVSEQIGYRIASRSRVGALLGVFCLGLAVVGGYLARRGRLEHLGWIGPLGVAATSLTLLGVGRASREAVPRTVATTQFAETSPFANEIHVAGLAAVYSADKSSGPFRATSGGLFWPTRDDRGGTIVRMIMTDRDEWELRNLVLPAGQQFVPLTNSLHVHRPVRAEGTFGPEGLSGVIESGPFKQTADAVLALPSTRNLAVRLEEGGEFTAGADDILAPGQFLTRSVLSDEQRRRRAVYQALFDAEEDARPYPDEPTLLMWAQPLDLGFELLEGAEQTGAALVSLPLQLTPPTPGTRLVIPGPFVSYYAVGAETAVSYDARRRRWSGPFSQGLDTTLRFRLPNEVLPMRVDRATLTVEIKAPSRELEITGLVDGQFILLESRRSPLGRMEFEISREDVLQVNSEGELTLGVNVGDARDDESNLPLDPSEAQLWKIDDVQLEVAGVAEAP